MLDIASAIPVLETERLVLRGPKPADFEPIATFFADEERAWGFGGAIDRPEAWRWFASMIGHWALRGYGFWVITDKADGTPLGITGLWEPEGWPEPKLGWGVFEGAEGRGIAYEAAMAARAHAYDTLGLPALSSNIFPGNGRSIALAERMGPRFEREYDNVKHGRELVYRHPRPEAA
ncbi:GNAT family N-acetyltransferase [Acidimangrovimonas pyrenivorans]|uniref:GNAT family N-acetyltransferase n=1 Tax=Acidimangrovimonas pyrenivorans TaxID=2030798 RepID=A0ABV7AMS9_9RHOB